MNLPSSKLALGLLATLLAAACGGNVVLDSGIGGNGGTTGSETITDPCQHYANALLSKLADCGIEVTSTTTGTGLCSSQQGKLATCLETCVPLLDCACTVDPNGTGCADKLKPYADCVQKCA